MQRVIGMDIHRTFAEVVFWEAGRLRPAGRIDMTRSGLEGFGRSLSKEDEVVVEATGNAMAVVRVLSRHVARAIVANPLQVKAIGHAHVKTGSGLPTGGMAARCGNRAQVPAGGSPQPSRSASHPDQEAFHSSGASYPAVPTCRLVRPAGSELARTTGTASR